MWSLQSSQNVGPTCQFWDFLRLLYYDFAERSPIHFSACSPPKPKTLNCHIIETVRAFDLMTALKTRPKYQLSFGRLHAAKVMGLHAAKS